MGKLLKTLAVSVLALILLCSATVRDDDDRSPLKDGFELVHSGFVMCFKHNGQYGFAIGSSQPHIYGYYDFSDIYVWDWGSQGYLIWVARGKEDERKWGVFNGVTGQMETEFIYDKYSLFTKVGRDEKTMESIYRAKVMIGERLDSISIKVFE